MESVIELKQKKKNPNLSKPSIIFKMFLVEASDAVERRNGQTDQG